MDQLSSFSSTRQAEDQTSSISVTRLKTVLSEHLALNATQLNELSSSGPFVKLMTIRSSSDDADEQALIATKKECIKLVSQRSLSKVGSACCAVKHIDDALRVEAVISEVSN